MAETTEDRPLAVYNESLPQVRRQLRLFENRVEVDALWRWPAGKKRQALILLRDLEPEPRRRLVRNKWFKNAILAGSLAVAFALVFSREGYAPVLHRTAWGAWTVAALCALVAALCAPRRQFATFLGKDGRPRLDFCNSGPDRVRYESFVSEVARRIRKARG